MSGYDPKYGDPRINWQDGRPRCDIDGKVIYDDQRAAILALGEMRANPQNRGACRYYFCEPGNHYHLTSQKNWKELGGKKS